MEDVDCSADGYDGYVVFLFEQGIRQCGAERGLEYFTVNVSGDWLYWYAVFVKSVSGNVNHDFFGGADGYVFAVKNKTSHPILEYYVTRLWILFALK